MPLVYGFDHPHPGPPMELKGLLGGKGANLAEMSSVLGLPVPPGFTITTEACRHHMLNGWPDDLTDEVDQHLDRLESAMGATLGDPDSPLLVSVRSGARLSMPGMMDTVLNLGLNDSSVEGLARATDDHRFALDSYRRLIQMYARIVFGLDGYGFERVLADTRSRQGVATDAELAADALTSVVDEFRSLVEAGAGIPFPQDPREQLRGAIEAVFESWNSPRAVAYRSREHISGDDGTAVNVQAMVFGNRDDRSGTGVGFTRNPATGEPGAYGDFLVNAQGEDVVAGIRKTLPLAAMEELFPGPYEELLGIFDRLESHYRDMMDTEFTVEADKLWMLQTRVGKRTGAAALKIAVALTRDPRIGLSESEAVQRVTPEHLDQLLHPQFADSDPSILVTGLAASPGAAVGRAYFSSQDAVDATGRGERVILVREETSPEDVHGMEVAEGVLTSRGGLVSHAAVVARGWGKPAVVGADGLDVGEHGCKVGGSEITEGELISINGTTGQVARGELALSEASMPEEFELVLGWADELRGSGFDIRANADNATDAERALGYGAEGIGLARTEHMFLGDRLPLVRRMILASDEATEAAALADLLEVQRGDFTALFEVMDGRPVTIRLLDPPLHEFLPDIEELVAAEAGGQLDEEAHELFAAARHWQEVNPMLGTRGVRLGVLKDGLYRMQVRAAAQAALVHKDAGGTPRLELMVPLVVTRAEMALVRSWIEEELDAVLGQDRSGLDIPVGSMIETPRAALCADDMAEVADFFSFGTNDLTQMTFGFSRDDVEGRLMSSYMQRGLLARNPFETIDRDGVGELVRMAVQRGRSRREGIGIGVCGEHGGDPESIGFFYEAGLDYVSCSPFRIPVARLAAAQAVLAGRESGQIRRGNVSD